MSATIFCEKYRCTMRPEACVARQKNASDGAHWTGSASGKRRPGALDVGCRNCEQGRQVAARVAPVEVEKYRRSLSAVRRTALTQTIGKEKMPMNENPKTVIDGKTCNICGETKPPVDYYKTPATKDGRENRCKACAKNLRKNRPADRMRRSPSPNEKPATPKVAIATPDIAPVATPDLKPSEGTNGLKLARLSGILTGRKMWTRAELMEIRDLCFSIQRDINTYLALHAMFAGGSREEAPHA